MAQLFDFRKSEPTKVEKAIEMLQRQMNGLQRQIAGVCLDKGISPQRFAANNHKDSEILKFLVEAEKAEEILVNTQNKEEAEKNKALELLRPKNGKDL